MTRANTMADEAKKEIHYESTAGRDLTNDEFWAQVRSSASDMPTWAKPRVEEAINRRFEETKNGVYALEGSRL
jgi:hypothetical protein